MPRFAVRISLVVFLTSLALAQLDPASGILPFSTHMTGLNQSVDLATGNILVTIPIRNKIGKIPFTFQQASNSHAYQYTQSGTTYWGVTGGFSDFLSPSFGMKLEYTTASYTCNETAETIYTATSVLDATLALHPVPSTTIDHLGCYATSATLTTTDDSGYTATLSSPTVSSLIDHVYDRAGNTWENILPSEGVVEGYLYDPDGAYIEVLQNGTGTTYTDTFDQTAIKEANNQISYTENGTTQSFNQGYTSYYQETAFGCSGVTDIAASTFESPFLTSLSVPGVGSYTFQYEITPSKGTGYTTAGSTGQYTTGRIGQITFPSGGSVSYTYLGGNNGVNCTSAVVPELEVTVNDNNGNKKTWTYVNSNSDAPSKCAAGSTSSCNFTVIETDPEPAGNQTVYSFAGEYQTQSMAYQGGCPTSLSGVLGVVRYSRQF
ncbi:MAG TPA: hypothetical protein VEK33_25715 [Terriglobales bacterium]|nr:hypothetical protein [Terriglobales bacterium]